MADTTTDMLAKSSDYLAMEPYWTLNNNLMAGAEAMRAAGQTYLPQFPEESSTNYSHRLKTARFTNIYSDIVENLALKPFTKEVGLANDNAPDQIKAIVEDVDRAGNHLHVFAQDLFQAGIAAAIDWILVDHTKTPEGATLEDERRLGARPFWVRVAAHDMLAVYSDMIDGKEQFIYARMRESRIERDGHEEVYVERVRVLIRDQLFDEKTGMRAGYGPARFEVWKQETKTVGGSSSTTWEIEDAGDISIGIIPLVPFFTGRRVAGTWQISPPMRDVAELQVQHYRQETNLENAKELTAFPMLSASGVSPQTDAMGNAVRVPVGPAAVLYAPMNDTGDFGEWKYIEPSAQSLKFLSEEIDKTERQMRELGRQPLVAGTAGITQIAAALASQKASSAIQAWAFLLKDALEKAFRFTAMWLGIGFEATVYVDTDFAIDLGADKAPETLLTMHERNAISTETLRSEMKRRSILSPEFDNEAENARILEEIPGDASDEEQLAALSA